MKKSTFFLLLLASCLLFLFPSCDSNKVFEDNTEIPDYSWDAKNKVAFDVNIEDTVSKHNFFINVRHASQYPYANINVFVTIKFPNGKMARDTVNCMLADPGGQWIGEGMGDIWDSKNLWKQNVKFPLTGKYTFVLEHAMRMEQVPFVMDVGLRIEKAAKK